MANKIDEIIELLKQINDQLAAINNALQIRRGKRELISKSNIDPKAVLSLYNEILGQHLGHVQFLTEKRKRMIIALANKGVDRIELWREYFNRVASSPFLLGINKHHWRASMDWLLRHESFVKVFEGVYSSTSSLPDQYAHAIELVKRVARGEDVSVQQSAAGAEVLADIHAALVMHNMQHHRAYAAIVSIAKKLYPSFQGVILSRDRLQDSSLAAAIIYAIKSAI